VLPFAKNKAVSGTRKGDRGGLDVRRMARYVKEESHHGGSGYP
jgi:hypothetical protein